MATNRHRLKVSFTPAELERVNAMADQFKLSVSEMLRRFALGETLPDPSAFAGAHDLLKVNADQARLGNLMKLALDESDGTWSPAMVARIDALVVQIQDSQTQLKVTVRDMRRRAALSMRWEDVDLEVGTLFVPLPKGGKKRAFSLPLSDSMVDLLKARKEQNVIFFGADNPWVWPAQSSAGHITEPKLAPLDEKKMGMTFIMHALRHTFATCANASGTGIYDLKLLMNHALSGDVTTVYVGSGEHLRRAQQKVTDYINGWMLPEVKAPGPRAAEAELGSNARISGRIPE